MPRKISKEEVIEKFKTHKKDTGSTEVQIGILTKEINELALHLKRHRHDFSSRRGLLRKVGKRKKLLRYLERQNRKRYAAVVKKLKI